MPSREVIPVKTIYFPVSILILFSLVGCGLQLSATQGKPAQASGLQAAAQQATTNPPSPPRTISVSGTAEVLFKEGHESLPA